MPGLSWSKKEISTLKKCVKSSQTLKEGFSKAAMLLPRNFTSICQKYYYENKNLRW